MYDSKTGNYFVKGATNARQNNTTKWTPNFIPRIWDTMRIFVRFYPFIRLNYQFYRHFYIVKYPSRPIGYCRYTVAHFILFRFFPTRTIITCRCINLWCTVQNVHAVGYVKLHSCQILLYTVITVTTVRLLDLYYRTMKILLPFVYIIIMPYCKIETTKNYSSLSKITVKLLGVITGTLVGMKSTHYT